MDTSGKNGLTREQKIQAIRERIKTYPNFPKDGIMFKDIFPLAHNPSLLPVIADLLCERLTTKYPKKKIDLVVGIDSRGFLVGPELARLLQADFIPARKKGKLPGKVSSRSYDLEYGSATLEVQKEYLVPGKVAVVVDDLIATGGTMAAVYTILHEAGVEVLECQCIVELPELKGRENLPNQCPLFCLVDVKD